MRKLLMAAALLSLSAVPLPFLSPTLAPQAQAQKKADAPYVKLPAKLTAKPNRYFHLTAETNCPSVRWIIPDGLEPLDPAIPLKNPNTQVLIGDTGTYKVQAYGALGDQASDIAICTVTIGQPPPPPPPPPPDALTAALQAAYAADADADKATSLDFLAAAYAAMATAAPTWTAVKTNGDALTQMKAVIEAPSGLKPAQVKNLRTAIAADFVKVFGTVSTTPIDLAALAAELAKIAAALKGVK